MAEPTIAIVGCGAVARLHLMVLERTGRARATCFVDKDLARAQGLADEQEGAFATTDHRELIGRVDAAIVALPHHLHAPVSSDLLRGGVHVLVEKPMALTTAECDAMLAAARESGATLAVGVARRFYDATRFVKRLLDGGSLGRVLEFEASDGAVYSWPVVSDFMFRRETGGGVLADTGAHVLDRLVHWLGDFESVECLDDSMGGVEADCELRLVMRSGARGTVRLSRIRDLPNRWTLRCERGELEVETKFDPRVTLRLDGQSFALGPRMLRDDGTAEDPLDCFCASFVEFVDALEERRPPLHSGEEGRRSVALLEACHASRRTVEPSWSRWVD